MEANKGKEMKTKGNKGTTNAGEDKAYMRWGLEMERVLADILRDERSLGHKGDGGWKTIAYTTASSMLTVKFKTPISVDNVKNRVKAWKKIYGVVSGILSQSGLSCDGGKHMISVDDENVWNDYIKVHTDATKYRYKMILNWDDIVDLCGKDRATGVGDENTADADEVMSNEGDNNECRGGTQGIDDLLFGDDTIPSNPSPTQKKRGHSSFIATVPPPKKRGGSKDTLSIAVSKMGSSFEEYMRSSTKKLDVGEVYDEVTSIPDLDRRDCLRALDWLVENENKFYILKRLPLEDKKNFIMMCMPRVD